MQAGIGHNALDRRILPAVRRPEPIQGDGPTGDAVNELLAARDILRCCGAGNLGEVGVGPTVDPHLVTLRELPPDEVRILPGVDAQDEEGRLRLPLGQNVQELGGVGGMRAVVEGQRDRFHGAGPALGYHHRLDLRHFDRPHSAAERTAAHPAQPVK